MPTLEIKKAGDPVLREKCQPIDTFDRKLRLLLNNMADTMYKADGVGLAAPQIGLSIAVVVIDVGEGIIEMINPKIIEREGTIEDTEGCLSVPGVYGTVERSARVVAEFQNRYGKKRTIEGTELLARAIQHELDHLEGILFTDKVTSFVKPEEE